MPLLSQIIRPDVYDCYDAGNNKGYSHDGKLVPVNGLVPRNHCVVTEVDGTVSQLLRFTPYASPSAYYEEPVLDHVFTSPEQAAETHIKHLAMLEEVGLPTLVTDVFPGKSKILNSAGLYIIQDLLPPGGDILNPRKHWKEFRTVTQRYQSYLRLAGKAGELYMRNLWPDPNQFSLAGETIYAHDAEPVYGLLK